MECRCGEDAACADKKRRIEPCRAAVTWQSSPNSRVACSAATWICLADPLCATALDYYNRNCQAMFRGRKCSRRCRNSLDILLRQGAATKLATCTCDGTEEFECASIRENTDVLCFGKTKTTDNEGIGTTDDDSSVNEIDDSPVWPVKSGSDRKQRGSSLLLSVLSLLVSCLLPQSVSSVRSLFAAVLH
jgi:growth arrest-specific protein 1